MLSSRIDNHEEGNKGNPLYKWFHATGSSLFLPFSLFEMGTLMWRVPQSLSYFCIYHCVYQFFFNIFSSFQLRSPVHTILRSLCENSIWDWRSTECPRFNSKFQNPWCYFSLDIVIQLIVTTSRGIMNCVQNYFLMFFLMKRETFPL